MNAASSKSKALKAYKTVLSKRTITWDGEQSLLKGTRFALINVNNDQIPELIIQSDNNSHAMGSYCLYTYHNGKVKCVRSMEDGFAYYPNKSFIKSFHGGGSTISAIYTYYQFAGTVVTPKLSYADEHAVEEDQNGDGKIAIYYYQLYKTNGYDYNEKQISKKAFKKILNSKVGKTKLKKPNYHKNNASNRNKYLR